MADGVTQVDSTGLHSFSPSPSLSSSPAFTPSAYNYGGVDRMGFFLLFPGHSKRSILDHHFFYHHVAHMAVHTLFHEPDVHNELHDAVRFTPKLPSSFVRGIC